MGAILVVLHVFTWHQPNRTVRVSWTSSTVGTRCHHGGSRGKIGRPRCLRPINFTRNVWSSGLYLGMVRGKESDNGILPDRVAVKRAKAIQDGKGDFKKRTLGKKAKYMIIGSVPVLFAFAVVLFYASAVFALFKADNRVEWKLLVTLFAFAIKVGGNKILLKLVSGMRPWLADQMLFTYEFITGEMA